MIRNVYNGWLWHEWLPGITSWNLRVVVWVYCPGHAGGRSNKGHPSLEYWMSRDELLWKINESVEWWHNSCRNSTIAAAGVGKLVWNESVTIERDGPGVWLINVRLWWSASILFDICWERQGAYGLVRNATKSILKHNRNQYVLNITHSVQK